MTSLFLKFSRPDGLFVSHFKIHPDQVALLYQNLKWLTPIAPIFVFLVPALTLLEGSTSSGRVIFILGMLLLFEMNNAIQALPMLVFVALGILFAGRWIVNPRHSYRRGFRITVFILTCWIGIFVASVFSRNIGFSLAVFDGIAYEEDADLRSEVFHAADGDTVLNLCFGWTSGFIFWGIARLLLKNRTEQGAAPNP